MTKLDTSSAPQADLVATSIFERVLCGVDGSDESLEAVRQASLLAPGDASIAVFGVVDLTTLSAWGGLSSAGAVDALEAGVRASVEAAARVAVGRRPGQIVVEGPVVSTARSVLDREAATLVAVGAKRTSRTLGVLLGSLATELVHVPRRPVLLARARTGEKTEGFPRLIVAGVDGSGPSLRALAVAREIGSRLGVPVSEVTALDDAGDVLSAEHADLIVLGSSGRTGIHALGSVSEHVAHHAAGSVLIVP